MSQLCTGSLGDPTVNITFGAGPNFGPPVSAATTNYEYASNACPVNGFYSLLSSGINCNYGWHVLTSDHTGDANGYFMLVDASFEPGDFYIDTVKSLCANTTYEFAAWMLNMKNVPWGMRPNITFTVETADGAVLQSYNSGDIPVEQLITWRQYGFYFTTPADVAVVVLRMRNNAVGGEGNDLALDDITFRPCGAVITSAIEGISSDTVHICEGDTSTFAFTAAASSAYLDPLYQWQISSDLGTTWADIAGAASVAYLRQPTGAGVYLYRVAVVEAAMAANRICRIASDNLVINVHPAPDVSAGADRIIFRDDTVHLNAIITGENPSWQWKPPVDLSDVLLEDPIASPKSDITYTIYAESSFGCRSSDAVSVKVVAGIFVPTAFTPNNDGINDRWRIPFLDPLLGASVHVYNRYGQLVYSAESTPVNWDGTINGLPQNTGTYVYRIRFRNGRPEMKGTFILLR